MLRVAPKAPSPDPREQALAKTLSLPPLVARVLLARGLDDPERIRAFLRPDLSSLSDPFLFRDMRKAVERIRQAIRRGESILVHGDYDVDGISGTVLLQKFFRLIHADVRPFIPMRLDGYSFGPSSIEAVKAGNHRLVISVDNGTNACEAIDEIQGLGCDVIVTDHHGTSENVASSFAMLNPRLPDAGYPDRDLAGVGVAFRLATAVAESLGQGLLRTPEFADFLLDAMACVALGTIADVAPLIGENRVLTYHGLRALAQSRNPGIRALLDSAGLSHRSPEVEDIAFRIAPLINAAGRMGDAMQAVELLTAPGYSEAQAAAKILESQNEERRRVERKLQDEVMPQARDSDAAGIVLAGDDWHPGVLGIVAARIAEETGKPAILISFHDDIGRGSGRCPQGLHLRNALAECSRHLRSHGGHAAAAGLEIHRGSLEAFKLDFDRACREMAENDAAASIDGCATLAELDPDSVRRMEMLGPFGMGHRRPRFLTTSLRTVGHPSTDMRGQALRIRVAQNGHVLPARMPRAARRFEEIRNAKGNWTAVHTPRTNARGEEGPIHLEIHELIPEHD
ncbi:MAG: single-stranded-DNA-specific exonuclease RecJ [Planctomycetota bacterium]